MALWSAPSLPDLAARERAARGGSDLPTSASHVHSLAHGQRSDAAPVEAGGERVADAADRLGRLWRLRSTSSILASSCSDMSLNSRPSWANSSLP